MVQINERGRYLGFREPDMAWINGHAGLYIGREPDNDPGNPLWASIPATREPLERVDRVWRGIVMDTYAMEKFTGWTPELSPPPDSPLFRWRVLAGEVRPRQLSAVRTSFRGTRSVNYDVYSHIGESRDSGSGPEPVIGSSFARTRWDHPGMTGPKT